jgi:hypothetical protein
MRGVVEVSDELADEAAEVPRRHFPNVTCCAPSAG